MARAMAGVAAVLILACLAAFARAQDEPLGTAVFDFETKGETLPADAGAKIADLLTLFLSNKEDLNLKLVDRDKLTSAVEDLGLSNTGDLDPDDATRLGSQIGAQLLITGIAMPVNDRLYLTAKLTGVETNNVAPQLVKGASKAEMDAVVQQLADKIAAYLKDNRANFIPRTVAPANQVKALRIALAKKNLPTVSVVISQRVVGAEETIAAAEKEFASVLKAAGVPTVSSSRLGLDNWARDYLENPKARLPDSASRIDVVFVGDGLSEITGRTQEAITVRARLKMTAVDVATNKALLAASQTVTYTSPDKSEQAAGKIALQKAADQVALDMTPGVVDQWNKLHPLKKEPAPKKAPAKKLSGVKASQAN
jgi:hypothetical protein